MKIYALTIPIATRTYGFSSFKYLDNSISTRIYGFCRLHISTLMIPLARAICFLKNRTRHTNRKEHPYAR